MGQLLLFLLLVVNSAVAWRNAAKVVGYSRAEAQRAGGWSKLMAWRAEVVLVSGFASQVHAVIVAFIMDATGYLPQGL